jgi:hypothetical protein
MMHFVHSNNWTNWVLFTEIDFSDNSSIDMFLKQLIYNFKGNFIFYLFNDI